jgi:hypothetical protein
MKTNFLSSFNHEVNSQKYIQLKDFAKSLTARYPEERPDCNEILKIFNLCRISLEELKISDRFLEEECDIKKRFTQYFIQQKFKSRHIEKV